MEPFREGMDSLGWQSLLVSISEGMCTPLLGPGLAAGVLPLAADVAQELAAAYRYPLSNTRDLAEVAEYVAMMAGEMVPRYKVVERLREALGYAAGAETPYDVLARLPIPLYLTTGFDDLMELALRECNKDAQQVVSPWHRLRSRSSGRSYSDSEFDSKLTPRSPLVFHLYGHMSEPESLVVREGDYLEYVAAAGADEDIFPLRVRAALANSMLLVLGESIHSWSFRAFHRIVNGYLNRRLSHFQHVIVVSPSDFDAAAEGLGDRARAYTRRYLEQSSFSLYVTPVGEFLAELGRRAKEMGFADTA
jgi:hypothetical protein